jgi:hypothetical protein
MPDEILITKIENMLAEIVRLGGENERSQMVPNLTVQNANPSGLDGFIIVSDDRDGDNIVAKKVGSVIYADNDLVNVIFPHGGEAIAFQQGSQSANSGIWEIVPSTTTDIFYDKGNVGIGLSTPESLLHVLDSDAGIAPNSAADVAVFEFSPTTSNGISLLFPDDKIGQIAFGTPSDNIGGRIRYFGPTYATVSRRDAMVFVTRGDGEMIITGNGEVGIGTLTPDAQLESFDATGTVQLRLSFEDSVKFADFSVDTNHDLTITPSSTGQVILQPTTDSTDFFQVLDADGGTPILNVDATNERVGIGDANPIDKLTIVTPATGGANALSIRRDSDSDSFAVLFRLGVDGTYYKSVICHTRDAGVTNGRGQLRFAVDSSDDAADVNVTGDVVMTIDNNANVGIGTTSPTMSQANVGLQISDVTAPGIRLTDTNAVNSDFEIYSPAGINDLRIYHINNATDHLTIQGGGNIGINGITSPSTELDIGAGAIEFEEMTAPGAGAANTARLFSQDNGAGKTQLAVRFNTGAIQILATEP